MTLLSFPAKNLGAFGMGAIVTNSKKHYIYALRARNRYKNTIVNLLEKFKIRHNSSCYFKY